MAGSAVRFDASADRLVRTTGVPDYNAAYTICAWILPNTLPSNNVYAHVFGINRNAGSNYDVLYIKGQASTQVVTNAVDNGTYVEQLGATDLSTATWYFVAFIRTTNANSQTYLGNLTSAAATQASANTTSVSGRAAATRMEAGAQLTSNIDRFDGRIANIKVWTRALTVGELIQEQWQYQPIYTNSLHLWTPLLASGSVNDYIDYSGNARDWTTAGTLTAEDGPPLPWGAGQRRFFIPVSGGTLQTIIPGGASTFTAMGTGLLVPGVVTAIPGGALSPTLAGMSAIQYPALSTLTDDFEDNTLSPWGNSGTQPVTVSGGTLRITLTPSTTGGASVFRNNGQFYDARDSYMLVDLAAVPAAVSQLRAEIWLESPNGDRVAGWYDGGTLNFRRVVGGTPTTGWSTTYVHASHRIWRFRYDTGTALWYLDVSADGVSWTTNTGLASAGGILPNAVRPKISASEDAADAAPGQLAVNAVGLVEAATQTIIPGGVPALAFGGMATLQATITIAASGTFALSRTGAASVLPGAVSVTPGGMPALVSSGTASLAPGAVSVTLGGTMSLTRSGAHTAAATALIVPGGATIEPFSGTALASPGAVTVVPGGTLAGNQAGTGLTTPGQVTAAPGGAALQSLAGIPNIATLAPIAPGGVRLPAFIGAALTTAGPITITPGGALTLSFGGMAAPATAPTQAVAPGGSVLRGVVGVAAIVPGTVALAMAGTLGTPLVGIPVILPGAVTLVPGGVRLSAATGSAVAALVGLTVVPGGVVSGTRSGVPAFAPGAVAIIPGGVVIRPVVGMGATFIAIAILPLSSTSVAANPASSTLMDAAPGSTSAGTTPLSSSVATHPSSSSVVIVVLTSSSRAGNR